MTKENLKAETKLGGAIEVTPIDHSEGDRSLGQNEAMLGVNAGIGSVQVGADGSMTVSEGETHTVTAHKETAGLPVAQTLETSFGRPVSVQDALKNPSETLVSINGSKTDLQSAINAGLVEVRGDSIVETNWNETAQSAKTHTPTQFMSNDAKTFVNVCREVGEFDATFSAVLAYIGQEKSDKSVAAVTKFATEIGAKSYEDGVARANALITDVMQHTEAAMLNQYAESTVEGALNHFMEKVEPQTRASIFRGLMMGDGRMLTKIVEMYQLGNS
jgi:hypothetical protein